jgi:hypothetical protein
MEQLERQNREQLEAQYKQSPWGQLIAPNREALAEHLSSLSSSVLMSYLRTIREQLSKMLESPVTDFQQTTFIRGQLATLDSVLGIKERIQKELEAITEEQKVKKNG